MTELGRLADMHAQGADMRADDTFVSPRCADVMERLRGSEDIARAEANEDMLAAVLPEWETTGSSARGAHKLIGTAPRGASRRGRAH